MSIFNNSRDKWIENPDDDIGVLKDPTQIETSDSDDENPAVRDFKKREAAALQQPRNQWDNNGETSEITPTSIIPVPEDKKRLSSAELLAAGAFGNGSASRGGGSGFTISSTPLTPAKSSQPQQYNNDEGHDSDMSMSDSGRSDDDFASTSTNTRYVEEMLDDFRTINDLPHQEHTSLFTKVNNIRREYPIGQNEEIARLLDCTYQLVIRRRDQTIRVEEFLKIMSHCFDKILTDNSIREWTESTHKSVWLLCALYIRLFATKLKFLEPSDPMMQSEYFFTAYLIFSEKINFHHYHLRSSSRYLPVHFDDPGLLENCTIYNHSSLLKGPGQHFKALLYVFAKYDGFDHLKKVVESRLVFNCEPENLDMLLKIGKFLSAITSHLHVQFCSTSAAFAREILKLLNEASDSQWMFKELKNLIESPLIELTLVNKELSAVLLNRQTIDREFIRKVDDVQLRFLLK
jgi:CRISPR/Cas system CSM-associated protein Csm2 small subunit